MSNILMQSVIALTGNKAAATAAAGADVLNQATRGILHADFAAFVDTGKAIAAEGGETKAGEVAKSTKGIILAALRNAEKTARTVRGELYPEGRKGQATDAQKAHVAPYAAAIRETFLKEVTDAMNSATNARRDKAAETKAAKEKAAADQAAAKVREEKSREAMPRTEFIVPHGLDFVVNDNRHLDAIRVDGYAVSVDTLRTIVAEYKAAQQAAEAQAKADRAAAKALAKAAKGSKNKQAPQALAA